jgi:hypothetical protein
MTGRKRGPKTGHPEEKLQRVNLSLDAKTILKAKALNPGNLSAAVRHAVAVAYMKYQNEVK